MYQYASMLGLCCTFFNYIYFLNTVTCYTLARSDAFFRMLKFEIRPSVGKHRPVTSCE